MNCTKRQRDAYELKLRHRGPHVYFRGLIEISNKCCKNCLYCGIRCGNCGVERYEMTDEQVLKEAQFALDAGYGSIAIQGGERCNSAFIERITKLVYQIRRLQPGGGANNTRNAVSGTTTPERATTPEPATSEPTTSEPTTSEPTTSEPATSGAGYTSPLNNLGITLSLGEQSREVYREWKNAGAQRYLLRIEASNRELYEKLHPGNQLHSYDRRLQALHDLKSEGYLLGSGIMIGLPFQTHQHLDEDLQFLKNLQVDMVGMGPYIPHKDTPLGKIVEFWKQYPDNPNAPLHQLPEPLRELASLPRGDFWNLTHSQLLNLSIDMVARLRILMPHINIAATTALQVLHPDGREMALLAGANVIMPNMTETHYRGNYSLYEGKQGVADDAQSTRSKLLENLSRLGIPVGWNEKGDWR